MKEMLYSLELANKKVRANPRPTPDPRPSPDPDPNPNPNPNPHPNPNPNPNPGPNQMLRLLRAVEPVSSSVSEAQLAEALAPLARHLPGHVAGDVT